MRTTSSFVCEGCFRHPSLRKYVKEQGAVVERCDYCHHRHVVAVEIGELTDIFQNFMKLFEEHDASLDTLQYYLDAYEPFNEGRLDETARAALFEDIINAHFDDDDGEPPVSAGDYYRYRRSVHSEWTDFTFILHEDPDAELDFPEWMIDEVMARSIMLPTDTEVFRARPGYQRGEGSEFRPYEGVDIAPPPTSEKDGRAHRVPERVFYGASEPETAVAEVRPARGRYVSLCSARLRRDARVLDLTELRPADPFFMDNDLQQTNVAWLFAEVAGAMAEPQRYEDHVEVYRPTQAFAAFAAACGCDGIRYPSALAAKGQNLVFFDPDLPEIGSSRLVRVTAMRVWFKETPEHAWTPKKPPSK